VGVFRGEYSLHVISFLVTRAAHVEIFAFFAVVHGGITLQLCAANIYSVLKNTKIN
jgi:hypothetical protein